VAVAERRAEAATQMRALAADRERQAVALRDRRAWRDRAEAADVRLGATAARGDALAAEQSQLAGEPEALAEAISSSQRALGEAEAQAAAARLAEGEAEADLAAATAALRVGGEALADAREVRAGAEARAQAQAARRDEHERACRHAFDCAPPQLADRFALEPATVSDPSVEADAVKRFTAERERIGAVNLVAADELAQLESRAAVSAAERDELQQAVHQLRGSIGHLNREGRVRLLDAFAEVDRHFQSLFTTLFDGGQAQLQLIESDDPLEAGLEILAQPPGKRLAALTLLSGGEQALTAVALIFAFFLTNPAPICVLDEVDAPLDDANVDRFCTLLERMRGQTDTRYLIVTHNAVTMSRMDRLYGVTMVEQGVSRLVSVDLGTAETLLAAE
jgi:chromosome segregation protein